MALLINKLFSNKKKVYGKHQDNSDRAFTFSKEQVRIILFRECDFRGRKLLFDSETVQKIPVIPTSIGKETNVQSNSTCNKNEVYVEVSNGYGYQYTRSSGDTVQLAEMVFGSVAMSFRGTSFKIHSFSSPAKLMCTQVFPSPKVGKGRVSVSSANFPNIQPKINSSHSIENSTKLEHSSASSTSFIEQNIDSDIKIVPFSSSVPLDVPIGNCNSTNFKQLTSLEADSGFCGEQSYSSVSSGPNSMTLVDARLEHVFGVSLSCGGLYKRYLRSASTSLDHTSYSDYSSSGVQSSASADECMIRGHRSSKLGLAVIIQLTQHQENEMESFLLEHAALLEAMICRARANAEAAYIRPSCFASLMYDMYTETCSWLSDVLSGITIDTYLWHVISSRKSSSRIIDSEYQKNYNSSSLDLIKTQSDSNLKKVNSAGVLDNNIRTKYNLLTNSTVEVNRTMGENIEKKSSVHKSMLGLGRSDIRRSLFNVSGERPSESSLFAEKFVKELCELLETVDVKHTNFFISTLLTAVLTHHLGWVSTVNPPTQVDKDIVSKLPSPCNPLWGQLTDLYGAVGYPTKMSRTIICGNNKCDVITKILNILTYFIRCSCVERNNLIEYSPTVNLNCIIDNNVNNKRMEKVQEAERNNKMEQFEMSLLNTQKNNVLSISKSSKTDTNHKLLDVEKNSEYNSNNLGLKSMKRTKSFLNDLSTQNCEDNTVFLNNNNSESKNFMYGKLNEELNSAQSALDCDNSIPKNSSVVFVLGEDDELIGLNKKTVDNFSSVSSKETSLNEDGVITNLSSKENSCKTNIVSFKQTLKENCIENAFNIPSSSSSKLQRPSDLKIPNKVLFSCSSDSSPDDSSSSNCTGACEELSPCSECDKMRKRSDSLEPGSSKCQQRSIVESDNDKHIELRRREDFNRSQSVPPSDKNKQQKCSKSGCKKKYSGVKFDMRQYPQIVTNYMRSKDLELSQLPFGEKSLKLNRSLSTTLYDNSIKFDFSTCDCEPHDTEVLQTPSNASELEFTSDLDNHENTIKIKKHKSLKEDFSSKETSVLEEKTEETIEHPLQTQEENENNAIFEHDMETLKNKNEIQCPLTKMTYIEFPIPSIAFNTRKKKEEEVGYTRSLIKGVSNKYISDMVLQGTTSQLKSFEHILKRDLNLMTKQPLLDQPIQEAVAIVANTDTWEVQLISSHTYIVERGCSGVRVCLSQLVANMLESLLHMWKLRTPSEYCLMHIESRLRELCLRSKTLAQLLMSTEFCNMDILTTTLQLEVNDIPLLMAIASTHTPQLAQKYGLSFQ